jgi:hypothetical protein
MDDKRIEEMLRESLSPSDEAMTRLECRAHQELAAKRCLRPALGILTWKTALATLGILVIIMSSVIDGSRQKRITLMTGGGHSSMICDLNKGGFLERKREMESLLAQAPDDHLFQYRSKGDDTL